MLGRAAVLEHELEAPTGGMSIEEIKDAYEAVVDELRSRPTVQEAIEEAAELLAATVQSREEIDAEQAARVARELSLATQSITIV